MNVSLSLQETSYLWPHRIPLREIKNVPINDFKELNHIIEQNQDKNGGELGITLHNYFGCSNEIYQSKFIFEDDSILVTYSPDIVDIKNHKVTEIKFRFSRNNPAGLNEIIKSEIYARLLRFPESELRIYYAFLGKMDLYLTRVNPSRTHHGFQTILKNYKDLLFEYALNNPEEFDIFSDYQSLVEEAHDFLSPEQKHKLIIKWFNKLYPKRII